MSGAPEHGTSPMTAVSNAMVKLHKEQFGRGPTNARSYFAGRDTLVCVLEDVLLPAERKMVEMGDHMRVRESRMAFQVSTTTEFVTAIEEIVGRKVRAFASGIDSERNVVFENFLFDRDSGGEGDGAVTPERARQLGEDGQVSM